MEGGRGDGAGLEIRLLGAPQIRLRDAPVEGLASAKSQALLFYLAATGRVHTRASLAALLWGDLPEAAARANLRKALHRLRQDLAPYLVIQADMVALAEEIDHWTDVVEFEALLRDPGPTQAGDGLRRAIDLYRGDFLEGFYVRNAPEFEDWWLAERGRLRDMMLSGLRALADRQARAGQLAEGIGLARRILDLEPWREGAHRRLMTWLALSGQRSAALSQYEICRRALADELAVEPDEETQALHDRIRRGDLKPLTTVQIAPQEVKPRRPAFLEEEVQIVGRPQEPFVGRAAQLRRLTGFLETALAGQGQLALVSGEAGWGKTRLLAEFSRQVQEEHPRLLVASGICTAVAETGDPYLPFREILRMLSADVEQAWAAGRITHSHALRLWQFLPAMAEALSGHGRQLLDTFIPSDALLGRAAAHEAIDPEVLGQLQAEAARRRARGLDAGVDQERIFDQVAALLEAVARHHPLLLILDDLHWADTSTLALLFHLSRRITGSRILILGAYRPEDISVGSEAKDETLATILAELKRVWGNAWVELGHEAENGRDFVDALLDSEPNRLAETFRSRMAQYTGGHPLFAVEMLRDMKEHGYIYQAEDGHWTESPSVTWDTLPRRVEGIIERRISRLDPALRATLMAASVEGEEFTAEVLAQVRRVDEGTMVGLLSQELAQGHHLVGARGVHHLGRSRISRYGFSHNLFQKYLYDGLDPVERAYLHEDVGRALERLYENRTQEVAPQLAWHFQQAGRLAEAVAYLQQAGDGAARLYANVEAAAYYRQALDLAIKTEARDLAPLYMRLGRALELDSQFAPALAVYEEMERRARPTNNCVMESASLMAQATIQAVPTAVHDATRAQAVGERALGLACDLNDAAAEAKILWCLALAYFFGHDLARAIEYGARSLSLARERNLQDQLAQTLNDLGGFVYMYSGQITKAKEALHEARQLWQERDNLHMLADSLASLATAHVLAGEFDEAVNRAEQAHKINQSIGNLWGQSYSSWKVGLAYWERGEISQAIATMEESVQLAQMAKFLPPQANTRGELAALYGELGAVEQGLELAHQALDLADTQNPAQVGHGLGILARLQLLSGDVAAAQASIDRASTDPYQASWRVMFHPVTMAQIELALSGRDWEQAIALTSALLEALREGGLRLRIPQVLCLRAQALLGLGQKRSAWNCLQDARAEAEAIGSRWTLWRILSVLSHLEAEASQAADLRAQARGVIEAIADQIDSPDLRTSFLSLPEVRAVLEPIETE